MKKLWYTILGLVVVLCNASVHAAPNGVLLCEIQTESAVSASEEFIKICNNSSQVVDVTGWHVQYFSSTVTSFASPTRNIALSGIIDAEGTYVVASSGYMVDTARSSFGATLSVSGGHIRLVSGTGASEQQQDVVGWGSAKMPEAEPATVVAKGGTYKRQYIGGVYVDTDNNKVDFSILIVVDPPVADPAVPTQTNYPAVEITELLPDPASPVLDSEGEYVEIYNPTDSAIPLEGYIIQTGLNHSYSYTIHNESIAAKQYKTYYALDTQLTLSNAEGGARMLSPAGAVLWETDNYGKAITGSSWSNVGGVWQWTSTQTANAANIADPIENPGTAGVASGKKPSTASSKAKTSSATKGATTTKATKQTATAAKTTYESPPSDKKPLPVNPFVLAGVGTIAVGYMIYEYRHDISNKYLQFKRNRSNRR